MTQHIRPSLSFPITGGAVRSPRGWTYLVGDVLGDGSFGSVFDCVGPFDQSFALKVFRPSNRPYAQVRAEWLREAERLYRLRHPNIVYVHDFFEADSLFYLVLERCHHSLEDMLGVPFTAKLTVDILRQLLFATQYLHDADFVHNDLHAGNVMVMQGDKLVCKLSDLGIAQELYGQNAVRPPIVHHRIMAPEVAGGGFSTKQSDLYQLGLLAYLMHTGEYPIDFSAGLEDITRQIREGVPRARAEQLGTPLGRVISIMLRRQEQYRYTSAAQVWEDLRRLDVWSRPEFEPQSSVNNEPPEPRQRKKTPVTYDPEPQSERGTLVPPRSITPLTGVAAVETPPRRSITPVTAVSVPIPHGTPVVRSSPSASEGAPSSERSLLSDESASNPANEEPAPITPRLPDEP